MKFKTSKFVLLSLLFTVLFLSNSVQAKYVWSAAGGQFDNYSSAKSALCSHWGAYFGSSNGRYSMTGCSASGVSAPYWNYLTVSMEITYVDAYLDPDVDRTIGTSFGGKLIPEYDDPGPGPSPSPCGSEGAVRRSPHPVDIPTGNKYIGFVDFLDQGPFPLKFEWNYNSQELMDSYIRGAVHSYSYSQSLQIRSNLSTVVLKRDDGKAIAYTLNSSGEYIPTDKSSMYQVSYLAGTNNSEYWKVVSPGAFEEYYNDTGHLVRIYDYNTSLQHTLTYDGLNIKVTHSSGSEIVLTYPSTPQAGLFAGYLLETDLSHPSQVSTPIGIFDYEINVDVNNRLEKVYFTPNESVGGDSTQRYLLREFKYDDASLPMNITRVIDGRGFTTKRVSYDSNGRVTLSGQGLTGEIHTFEYPSSTMTRVTNSFGYQTEYNYQNTAQTHLTTIDGLGSTNCSASISEFRYDTKGRTQYKIDKNNNVTYYVYNTDNTVKETYFGGAWNGASATFGAEAVYRSYTYTADGLVDTSTLYERDQAGTGWTSIYTIDYDYWSNNRLKQIAQTDATNQTNPFGSTSGQQRITTYTYSYHNGAGLPVDLLIDTLTVDGPLSGSSDLTVYQYDQQGHLLSATNALNQSLQYGNFNGRGQPQTSTDANGVVTEFGYHPRGWLETVTVKDPGGDTSKDAVTLYTWYPNGTLEQLTFPDGSFLHYEYNDAHNIIEIRNNLDEIMEFEPNPMGKWTVARTKDASENIKRLQNRAFDDLGRLMDLFGNNNQQTHYEYDTNSNLKIVTENGITNSIATTHNYDSLNRLKETLRPINTEQNGQVVLVNVDTQYGYDGANNLTSVTDPKGNTTTYVYNGFGEKITQISPDTGTTHYWYDEQGNLTQKRDARGITIQYHYDVLGRLSWAQYPNSGEDVHYYYDEVSGDNPYAIGKLTRVTDQSGSSVSRYDHRGNEIRDTRVIEGQTYVTEYRYNLADNLVKLTYPSGRIVNYYRNDVLGRVSAITTQATATDPEQNVITGIQYLPYGPIKQYTYGNGLVRQVPYDLDYRIEQIQVADVQSVMSLDYGYDAFNNITSILDNLNNSYSQTFAYDDLQRLQHAYGNYGTNTDHIRYEYDSVGNRTLKVLAQGVTAHTTETYTYDPLSNQLNTVDVDTGVTQSSRTLAHNEAGALEAETTLAGQSRSYTYNDNLRLIELSTDANSSGEYLFNALGQRVRKTVGQDTEHFNYDVNGLLLASSDGQGTVIQEHIYLGSEPIAVVINDTSANQTPFIDLSSNSPFTTQDSSDGSVVSSATSITLNGNHWRYIDGAVYTLTAEAVLEFDFSSDGLGEITGIGFDNNHKAGGGIAFNLSGTQTWGNRTYSYTGNGAVQHYSIPVGQFLTGDNWQLLIINDKDYAPTVSTMTVSNITICLSNCGGAAQ